MSDGKVRDEEKANKFLKMTDHKSTCDIPKPIISYYVQSIWDGESEELMVLVTCPECGSYEKVSFDDWSQP